VTTAAAGTPPTRSRQAWRPAAGPSFELAETKLHVPALRTGIVRRATLVDRLLASDIPPVISVVAPPGYGKTTMLAQWAERKRPRLGWVSADDRDNDLAVLLTYLVVAVDRIERVDPRLFRALVTSGAGIEVPRRLASTIAAMDRPVTLVIDHFETVTNRDCHDAIAELALGLPAGSQLAIGSREALPLPAARLRAQGGLVELSVDDLAMDPEEAASLVAEAGAGLRDADVDQLVARTEGWPVGLYLAALAVKAGSPRSNFGVTFSGDDRFMADYLRAELLDRVSSAEASFLMRTSVLERMCGPLCDAVLGATGSRGVLEQLESRNLLVVPLDRRREWYRYHHLFRDLLLYELRRREDAAEVAELHLRAAAWHEANGMPETAIDHAQAAGDVDGVARLVLTIANPVWSSGRADTVLRWMEWFDADGLVERYPGIAAHGALTFALAGRPGDTERWSLAAERGDQTGTLPDGNTTESTVAYLRALLCRNGLAEMRRDARAALDGLSPSSPYRAAMLHAEAVSHLLEGDAAQADAILARAVDAAALTGVRPFVPVLLAERGIAATVRDDRITAEALADEATTTMKDGQFDDYWTSALVYAWLAHVALQRGDVEEGRQLVARAARLRPLLNYALPVVSVQALLEMARSYLVLADPHGARAVLRQANDIFQQRPDLGMLTTQADALRAELATVGVGRIGVSSLTTAELRLLPLLRTHLSFPQIGERLYISRHTVKTQALSIYRKVGASSRSEAISQLYALGLLDPS
jgi:LuxR family transcriptional regulator, maltose regulon positive regulatory protein